MIDFRQKLGKKNIEKKINPIDIYASLDRRSETGPLRPSQEYILSQWFTSHKNDKNLIIKLHTGEGKTLIGLLILQSKLNSAEGPCLYLCSNKYLVEQTCLEADKFGISYCTLNNNATLPDDFYNGSKILITHVQKLFNGKTVFGLDTKSTLTKNIILDDAHACIDSIKASFTIKVNNDHKLYSKLLALFEEDLISQGEGTFLEIKSGMYNPLLPIPYWSWIDKKSEVLKALYDYNSEDIIKFTWPFIKDKIINFQGFISGNEIEITPIYIPIHHFGTFHNASQRILMSATTQDDSFFIKGLEFDLNSIKNPLINSKLKWSGEKMLLIPSLIDDDLDRDLIITKLAPPNDNRSFGIVSIVTDFRKTQQYKILKSEIVTRENIYDIVKKLKEKKFSNTIVLVNRYDGIDLPDETCRILIIDSKPFFNSLSDRYEEECRTESDIINIKIAQKIEQGIGRSVRGEKDYSVIILIGADLVKFIKSPLTNKYFSAQTRKQIDIGLQVVDFAKDDSKEDTKGYKEIIVPLIRQVLKRDIGWKEFYKNEMEKLEPNIDQTNIYEIIKKEHDAEQFFYKKDIERACSIIQEICDSFNNNSSEKGWYQQILARYKYFLSKVEANKLQKRAFINNYQLLKPKEGIIYKKLAFINENRIRRIKQWLAQYTSFQDLSISVDGLLSDLSFGMSAEKFEHALKEIGDMLGFLSQRPDKEYKKGPDNLWCGVDNKFFIFECKSEVDDTRNEINKHEAAQMNTHCAWFFNEYGDVKVKIILIIPIKNLSYCADFTHNVEIMRKGKLKEIKANIKSFVKELKNYNIQEISDEKFQEIIISNKLDMENLENDYSEKYNHLPK